MTWKLIFKVLNNVSHKFEGRKNLAGHRYCAPIPLRIKCVYGSIYSRKMVANKVMEQSCGSLEQFV